MKINIKYFDAITTEPIEIQETKNGKIEIHYLNDYPTIYDNYIARGQFTCWSNKGGDEYKLLIEKSFNEKMKDLYSSKVNENWLEFYNYIAEIKKKAIRFQFLPASIALFAIMIALTFLIPDSQSTLTFIISIILLVGFILFSNYLKLRNNRSIEQKRSEIINNIEKILGKKRFNEILDIQDEFVKEFYEKRKAAYEEELKQFDEEYEKKLNEEGENNENK